MFKIKDYIYLYHEYFYIGIIDYIDEKNYKNITVYPKIPIFNAAGLMLSVPGYKCDFLYFPYINYNDFYEDVIKNQHYNNFNTSLYNYYYGTKEYYEHYNSDYFLGESKSLKESTIYDKIEFNMNDKKIYLSMSSKIIYKNINNFSSLTLKGKLYSGLFETKRKTKPIAISEFKYGPHEKSFGDGCGNFYNSNGYTIEFTY